MTAPDTTPAPAPEAPARIPFVTDLLNLLKVLFSPGEVFAEQREKPTVWIPWLVVSILMVGATFFNAPFIRFGARLAVEARGQPAPPGIENIAVFSQVVAIPIVMLVAIAISAGIMYLVLLAAGGEARYKGLMCVSTFSAIVGVIMMLLTVVVLRLRGLEEVRSVSDLQVSFGLDLLMSQDATLPAFLMGLLRGVTPFSIWSLVITAIGVQKVEKQSSGAAWSAAVVSALVMLVVGALFAGLGGAR